MSFILRVLATAAAVWVAAWLLPGVTVDGGSTSETIVVLLAVSVIFGLVNAVVKPLFSALSTCFIIVTFGLFLFVINALMLLLTSWIAGQLDLAFHVDGFWWALLGSIVISLVSGFINAVLGTKRTERAH
ncbi:phage holin family protein [Tessaracoccus sp. SD287]|uniref:phage holin family protein n=1 Tax=Tessaracoccus sp. SD287 TaxID=2782008 RepID=UPI001A97A154|nr:phage holin family protein [Tessaracoccus sp. SD287]MBO1031806.1 phage holin family protein [Tessaracoccus sp. SD287]